MPFIARRTTTIPRQSFWKFRRILPVLSCVAVVSSPRSFAEAWTTHPPERRGPKQFPTRSTLPTEVLEAQLAALREGDLWTTYKLFSRPRRLAVEEAASADMRQTNIPPDRITAVVRRSLEEECGGPGMIGHRRHRILSVVTDPFPGQGLLLRTVCRVGIWNETGGSQHYLVTLTRQSDYDGGDPRDRDGFEKCWFVWSIRREHGGEQGEDETDRGKPPSGREKAVQYSGLPS